MAEIPLDGPILIVAGPGTGKTYTLVQQILRVLSETDTPPETIMCLTFTETAADEMRIRLRAKIGSEADKIQISTYHGLGSGLLRQYSDYLDIPPYENAIDELTSDRLLRACIKKLGAKSPLKYADVYIRDVKSLLSESKRSLLNPTSLRTKIEENQKDLALLSNTISTSLPEMRSISKKTVSNFMSLHEELIDAQVGEFGTKLIEELEQALTDVEESGKTTPLTQWKNKWLEKNKSNRFIVSGTKQHQKLIAFCDLFELYNSELKTQKLFDYDDMILQSIELLKNNDDLRFSIQEKYLYLLLDEFQDTNPAQFELVKLLTNNPVHEGRPNILAVGDDDQAIYAFQGADHTNMHAFLSSYKDVAVESITENRRSGQDIIAVANTLSGSIEQRLEKVLPNQKTIIAFDQTKASTVEQWQFASDAEECSWIADYTAQLHKAGTPLSTIAILAPKHRYLETIVSYLHARDLPVAYERRENILDDEVVQLLELICKTIVTLQVSPNAASPLLVELLSHTMWNIKPSDLWTYTLDAREQKKDLVHILCGHDSTKLIMDWLIRLSLSHSRMTFEKLIDECIGDQDSTSPLFRYYFTDTSTAKFSTLLNNLQLLRAKVKQYQAENQTFGIEDFLSFTDAYRQSGLTIMNTNPHHEANDAVQVMTVYRSKGREYDYVFVPYLVDEVWGSKSRDKSSALSLPVNLEYISYQGKTDDERRRILYVALTRAKTSLILSTHSSTIDGSKVTPLTLMNLEPQQITATQTDIQALITPHWHDRHVEEFAELKSDELVQKQLSHYRLSASDLNQFTDLLYGGPMSFVLYSLLRFPKASIPEALYGDAFHGTLEWVHRQAIDEDTAVSRAQAEHYFTEALATKPLTPEDLANFKTRGVDELWDSIQATQDLMTDNHISEVNFKTDNIVFEGVCMTGKIDRIHIDQKNKTITIYDFKTGKGYDHWKSGEAKLHTYKKQLMFYKLLIENSLRYRNFSVNKGILVFVERDDEGEFLRLPLEFKEDEFSEFKDLTKSVWTHIQAADSPDITQYPHTLGGIKQFENDLIKG